MSALTSTSTDAQVFAAYDDNASYAEDNSPAKARAFITACRILLRRVPKETGTREAHLTLTPDLIQKEMQAAQGLGEREPRHERQRRVERGGASRARTSTISAVSFFVPERLQERIGEAYGHVCHQCTITVVDLSICTQALERSGRQVLAHGQADDRARAGSSNSGR
jgi:hypothetical protein